MSFVEFHEGRLPVTTGTGSTGSREWQTETLQLASGQEVRNARWAGARRRWDIVTPALTMTDFAALEAFFDARRGRFSGFRFRDVADHASGAGPNNVSAFDQMIAVADGEETAFQLTLQMGGAVKRILKPVSGTVVIGVDGDEQLDGWSVDPTSGIISFETAPEAGSQISAGFEFDWPVRFDTDQLEISFEKPGAGRVVSLPLIELV